MTDELRYKLPGMPSFVALGLLKQWLLVVREIDTSSLASVAQMLHFKIRTADPDGSVFQSRLPVYRPIRATIRCGVQGDRV